MGDIGDMGGVGSAGAVDEVGGTVVGRSVGSAGVWWVSGWVGKIMDG